MDTDPLPAASPLLSLTALLLQSTHAIEFMAPPDWVAWAFIVAIAFCCLFLSAFVSGSEIAFFGLSPQEIDELKELNEKQGRNNSYFLISHSEQLLATILIVNNLVNITMVVLLTFAIGQVTRFHSGVVDFLVQTVFMTFLLLLFGEIMPKLFARGHTMKWVLAAGAPLLLFYRAVSPLSRLMVRSSSIVNHFVTKKADNISTDDLEVALEMSDVNEGEEKEMLEGILTFGQKEVSDIMISRVDVTAIEYHATWSEAVDTIVKSGFSRIPVYDTSQDSIRGILYSKDLLPYIGKRNDSFRWQTLLREAYFVPESRMIDDLLEDFRKRKIHIAIVIDEYGGTRGIVTLEDIIEEIVGEIDDEYDQEEKMYRQVGDGVYIFDAKIPLGDFCHVYDIEEEDLGDTGDAETLAGLILELKGDFPKRGEKLRAGDFLFTVLEMEKHRITKIKSEKTETA